MSIFLAIDLGTTGCRSILFDKNLKSLAGAYEEYGLITPKESWVEQSAELWWEMTLRTAKKAIEQSGIDPLEIKGIAVSSQGITIVPVDDSFNPLMNALSWLDVRAEEESEQIEKDFGSEYMFSLTGSTASAEYTLPKLLWIKEHKPEIFEKAYKFLMPLDFLVAKFTGKCVTDHSMASRTLMYDLKNHCWSNRILDFYGIDKLKLPDILLATEKAGNVLPDVAKELGISTECSVAVGAQDQKCAAYGVGLNEGIMTVSLGTAAAITKYWKCAQTKENLGINWCGYVEPESFVTEGVINTAGTCLRYIRDMFYKGEEYAVIDEEANQALCRGSSLIFHPYLNGSGAPHYYKESIGNFYGVNLATMRGDYALSVMEGVAFQMRVLLETMDYKDNVHSLILFGGAAKSDLWSQIIADVTGVEIIIPETYEAAGAGAARLAAAAAGEQLPALKASKHYAPGDRAALYEEKFNRYKDIEKRLWSR